jgi:hypothetical protein
VIPNFSASKKTAPPRKTRPLAHATVLARRTAWLCLVFFLATGPAMDLHAYRLQTKEQLWSLYHQHLKAGSLEIAENIHWLEEALRADFNNPLNALCPIKDKTEWEKYRYLFTMHLNLKLVDQYLAWGSQFNKREAYFFNAPWQQLNLESLDKAEKLFRYALVYWEDAKKWAKQANDPKYRWTELPGIQAWVDEGWRIMNGDLDYAAAIDKHLGKLAQVRQTFKNMDKDTY